MINPFMQRIIANSAPTPIAFIGSVSGYGDDGATIVSLQSPAGTEVGDLLIVIGSAATANYLVPDTTTGVSGGSVVTNDTNCFVWKGTCSVSGAGGSVIPIKTSPVGAAFFTVCLLVFRYAKWGGFGAVGTQTTGTMSAPSVDVGVNSVAIPFYVVRNNSTGSTISIPSGHTPTVAASQDGGWPRIRVHRKLYSSGGSTGAIAASLVGGSDSGAGTQIWINPI